MKLKMQKLRDMDFRRIKIIRTSGPLRALVAGFGVLMSLPILSACTPKEKNYAAITVDEVSDWQALDLTKSQNPKDRMKGVGIIAARSRKNDYNVIDYKWKLGDLATHSEYSDVRIAAVNATSDPEQLMFAAVLSPYKDSAMAALEKLAIIVKAGQADKWLLSNAVANARSGRSVRMAGVEKLTNDEDGLIRAYNSTDYSGMRAIFVEQLAAMADGLKTDNAQILVTLYSGDDGARSIALQALNDNVGRVMDTAQMSRYADTRMAAMNMLATKARTFADNKDEKGLAEVRRALEHIVQRPMFDDSKERARELLKTI